MILMACGRFKKKPGNTSWRIKTRLYFTTIEAVLTISIICNEETDYGEELYYYSSGKQVLSVLKALLAPYWKRDLIARKYWKLNVLKPNPNLLNFFNFHFIFLTFFSLDEHSHRVLLHQHSTTM